MGWLFSPDWSRKGLIQHLTRPWEPSETLRTECIRHCTVGNHLWCVFEVKEKETGKQIDRFICLFLLQNGGYDHGWGYKDITESCGPCELTCPPSYFELVPEPPNDWACEWRERVLANRARTRGLRVGDQVELSNGQTAILTKLRPLVGTINGCRYRIPRKMVRGKVGSAATEPAGVGGSR